MAETVGQEPEKEGWAYYHPYSVRWSELYAQLEGKEYDISEEELANCRAIFEAASEHYTEDIKELRRQRILDSPEGLREYCNERLRMQEVGELLAAEGLAPPVSPTQQ